VICTCAMRLRSNPSDTTKKNNKMFLKDQEINKIYFLEKNLENTNTTAAAAAAAMAEQQLAAGKKL